RVPAPRSGIKAAVALPPETSRVPPCSSSGGGAGPGLWHIRGPGEAREAKPHARGVRQSHSHRHRTHPEIPMRLLRRPLVAIPTILVVGLVVLQFAGIGRVAEGPDPASLVTVEKGIMVVSVVATGKVEPIT